MNDINQVCQLINNQTHIDSYLSQKAKWIPIKFIFHHHTIGLHV